MGNSGDTGAALVTGGAGFIGSHLVDGLMRHGYTVHVLDDFSSGQMKNIVKHQGKKGFRIIHGSINNQDMLKTALDGVDVVFHLAAIASVARSLTEPVLVAKVNTEGTLSVLEEARRKDVKKVVCASSAAVYGNARRPPLRESLPPEPISPYGATKAAGEAYCRSYSKSYGIETISLRYFNVYGSGCRPGAYSGVMMEFAEAAIRGTPMTIFGNGRQCRDFVNVEDVVTATMRAAEKRGTAGEAFNVATGTRTTILELANAFLATTAANKTRIVSADARAGDITQSWADISRARKALGYKPSVKLRDGLRRLLSWYATEYGGVAKAAGDGGRSHHFST